MATTSETANLVSIFGTQEEECVVVVLCSSSFRDSFLRVDRSPSQRL